MELCCFLFRLCIRFFNFYDVVDGSLLRCRVSGIRSVSLHVSNMLTLDGQELFPVRICFLLGISRVFTVEMRSEKGHVVVVVVVVVFFSTGCVGEI